MDGHKFKIGDTVRINGDRRIWEVSEVIEEVQKELIGGRNNEQSLSG